MKIGTCLNWELSRYCIGNGMGAQQPIETRRPARAQRFLRKRHVMTANYSFLAILVALSMVGCDLEPPPIDDFGTHPQAVHTVCGGDDVVIGIDVSQYQSDIDWDALAASNEVEFAYIRVGNGLGTDTKFARNWPAARRVGLKRGAYQYFRPGMDALEEAQHYLALIDDAGGYLADDLPPMIDVETSDDQSSATIVEAVRIWVEYVEQETGMRPVIYTGSYFWDDNVGSDAFSDYHVWTPHYTDNPCPLTSSSWAQWTIWQFTSTGRVTGIEGNVDINRFNGTREELDLWSQCSTSNPIADCSPPDWWCPAIAELVGEGLLSDGCDGFRVTDEFSRAEWAELVGKSLYLETTDAYDLCSSSFIGIPEDSSYGRYVAALAALDYGDGLAAFANLYTDSLETDFAPDEVITRCEAAFLVAEAWNFPADDGELTFSDRASIPTYCAPSVHSLVAAEVLSHHDGDFRPNDRATAGETAVMIAGAIRERGRTTPGPADFFEPSCAPADACQDQCEARDPVCDGGGLSHCQVGTNGCLGWSQPEACASGTTCLGGVCEQSCHECDPNQLECRGGIQHSCAQNVGGCWMWQETGSCEDEEDPDTRVEDESGPDLERFGRAAEDIGNDCALVASQPNPSCWWVVLGLALINKRRQRRLSLP